MPTNDINIPDLGRAIGGFQSAVHAHQAPYSRPDHRVTTVDGGGFQTSVKNEQEPPADNLRPTNEASD
jgi:hypothetical protein